MDHYIITLCVESQQKIRKLLTCFKHKSAYVTWAYNTMFLLYYTKE